ncbi:thioredoxin family protein [uncultured Vibrio sp.]|uniref:thioredoxin family protein n=1 Tax=uncultured Vibrio sp. TaxID=114054 RepID=UPI0025F58924|nr:thioredoxin family protein [uncultured Vibrio sp.]
MLLDTPLCNFGWKAPNFTLLNPDGERFTMNDCLGDKGLLILFICNHCPYVKRIAERLAQDTNVLMEEGINVLAVMSNDYLDFPADSPVKMKQFAESSGFRFPYLVDEDQSVGKAYDAICTPDFFGLNNKGELQYRGRLDDAKMGDSSDRVPELLNAMRLIAETGKGPETQYPSMGCSIKWRD